MPKEKVERILKDGRMHLHFVISLYSEQIEGNRHFLHEHPSGATSWRDKQMLQLLKQPRVGSVVSDQCMYGLRTLTPMDGLCALKNQPVGLLPRLLCLLG